MIGKINWHPTADYLKGFSRLLLIVGALGVSIRFFRPGHSVGAFTLFVAFGAVGMWRPSFLRPIYQVWMGFAFVIGSIVSACIVFFFYFLLITPIAIYFKITGRDALGVKPLSRARPSHWVNLPPVQDEKSEHQHLF